MRMRFIGGSLAAACLAGPALAQTLEVGAYPSNPPWEFKNEQSEFEGFEVDLVREIGERMGRDINIQDLGFQALFAATSSGRIDMAISTITITPERMENQSFTQPYYDSDLGLVTSQDDVNAPEDLEGRPVGALASSTGETWINANAEDYGFGDYRSYTAQQNLLLDVANGRVAGGIGDILGFEFAAEQMPQIRVASRIRTGEQFAIMMPKGSELLEEVNAAISEIKEDGTMAAIYARWLESEPSEGTSSVTVLPIPGR
ncbi:polar amino acid transport system substrate-binding protein [Palleronia marisminoris]|uniref:ABC transporter substrate-binding protein n=1 Tax=Palleronia marisminoris TaxID=315423 RepID=UPI0008DF8B14|nr:ABC transporter substrate-binding protein [Palleronia marisminoris]SFH27316.1 polar amino acid transport system substrate-binding protein [Palleronia marisminoris]